MTIEYFSIDDTDYEGELFIDGEKVNDSYVSYGAINVRDSNVAQKVWRYSYKEIKSNCMGFNLNKIIFSPLIKLNSGINIDVEINNLNSDSKGNLGGSIKVLPDLLRWTNTINFYDYVKYFKSEIPDLSALVEFDLPRRFGYKSPSKSLYPEPNFIQFRYLDVSVKVSLRKYLRKYLNEIIRIDKIISDRYFNTGIIFTSEFNFPSEIQTACKQYLEYFAKFLQDLGIEVTSELRGKTVKVLFSVTPTDDIEALDKIREALAIYLNLPASPIVYDDSFAAMRLQQQIENLQHSQKMAARELQLAENVLIAQSDTIQEKDTIISQKDSTIDQQNKIIEKITSKSIMMDSLENKEELEELYEGLKIGESEFLKKQFGIHLNPAKLIKTAVKNTFGKEDKKDSTLGLDVENDSNSNLDEKDDN